MMNMRIGTVACLVPSVLIMAATTVMASDRFRVKSIVIEGNEAFSDKRLARLMVTRPFGFFSRSYFVPEVFEEDLRNLVLFYQQNGYLEAAVVESSVEADSSRGQVAVSIRITEGALTYVEGVGIFGGSVFSDSILTDRIAIRRGDPFKRNRVRDAVLSILSMYADRGYLGAEVNPDIRINTETHRALIDFMIDEGKLSRIGQYRIEGLEKTRPHVVMRELLLRQGDIARYTDLLESQRRLYLTGLFRSVFMLPEPAADGDPRKKDVVIQVKENESVEFNLYVGYGSIEKGRTRVEILNNNLAGTARKLGLSGKVSFIGYGGEASFTEPRMFGLRWRTDVNGLYEYLEEPGYNIERIGGRVVFGRGFGRRSTVSLAYRYENSDVTEITVLHVPDELEIDIRSLALSLIYDTRDNLFNASRGSYLELSGELAGSFLRGSEDFWRVVGRLKRFFRLRSSTVLASALEAGWMDFYGESKAVPLNERFYTGGPNSLRGFEYRKVGPLDEKGTPVGGNFKIIWNVLEVRQTLYKMIGGAFFVDAGAVWPDAGSFTLRDIRSCVGIGLRANTPIGILRCDWGINTDRKEGEPWSVVYFNVGQAF
jgi:outer membrane protein insertion porin family